MDRILTHPILGDTPEGRLVNFTYDGQTLQGIEGEPIAAALRVAGVMTHRYTKKRHEPRGVFCAIGRCTDCVMVVNGKPNKDVHHSSGRGNGRENAVRCIGRERFLGGDRYDREI